MSHVRLVLPALFCAVALAAADPAAAPAKPAAPSKPAVPAAPAKPAPIPYQPVFRTNLNPELYAEPERAATLFRQRDEVVQKLLLERQRIITTDPKAREIHAKIMELNQELAVTLESKRAVRDLSNDLLLIDTRIKALEPKPAAPPEPVPAPAAKTEAPATSAAPAKPAAGKQPQNPAATPVPAAK